MCTRCLWTRTTRRPEAAAGTALVLETVGASAEQLSGTNILTPLWSQL